MTMSIIKRCVLPIMLTLVAAPHLVQARAPANAAPGSTNAAGSTASAGAAAPAGPAGATAPSGAVATPDPAPTADHDDDDWEGSDSEHNHRSAHRHHHARHDEDDEDDDVVNLGSNSNLPSGQRADSVVSIFGSANSEGEAVDVVSVFGNTRVTGPLTDAAVSVFGSTYVDSKIDGDAVSVFGDLELGPHADVGGDAVTVFGTLHRDPGSLVHGDARNIFTSNFGDFSGLRAWAQHCLLYGRPLALAHGLGWAWGLALSFLALYALIALMFRDSLSRCVEIVETQPGQTALAGVLATLFTPLLVMLLCVTVIGIAAVPFVVTGLFCAGAFGKAVILAWLGRRVTGGHGGGPALHPAAAVLIGGAIVLVLYLVPVLGFLVFNLVALMGFGAVVYTLILATRARQAARQDGAGTTLPPGAAPAASRGTAASASAASAGGTSLAGAPPADTVAPGPAPGPGAAPATPPPAQPKAQNETQAQSPGAPSATLSASLPRAGFWVRMAALLIDALLVGVVTSVLQSHSHVNLVLLAAYGAVMWKLRGSTVGGIVFDLHVVRLDGRALDWQTAIIRALGCFLSLAVAGLGFFWIAFDDGKQAWHDKIAGTAVVRVAKGVPLV